MKTLSYIVKGIVIGVATLVPGVSGGTMAIILGLYDDIIHAISSFFKDVRKNAIFLVTVGIGGLIGLFAFSRIVKFSLEHFHFPTVYLFIGIILGGIPVLYRKANAGGLKVKDWVFFGVGFALIAVMSIYNGTIVNLAGSTGILQFVFLFLAGIIIAVALILPGISTSFMLLALGMYEITVNAISEPNIGFLAPIALGVAFGVITTTKILETCMKKKPKQTYMLILGFVIGSVIEVFPGIPSGLDIFLSVMALVLGFVLIRAISGKFAEE